MERESAPPPPLPLRIASAGLTDALARCLTRPDAIRLATTCTAMRAALAPLLATPRPFAPRLFVVCSRACRLVEVPLSLRSGGAAGRPQPPWRSWSLRVVTRWRDGSSSDAIPFAPMGPFNIGWPTGAAACPQTGAVFVAQYAEWGGVVIPSGAGLPPPPAPPPPEAAVAPDRHFMAPAGVPGPPPRTRWQERRQREQQQEQQRQEQLKQELLQQHQHAAWLTGPQTALIKPEGLAFVDFGAASSGSSGIGGSSGSSGGGAGPSSGNSSGGGSSGGGAAWLYAVTIPGILVQLCPTTGKVASIADLPDPGDYDGDEGFYDGARRSGGSSGGDAAGTSTEQQQPSQQEPQQQRPRRRFLVPWGMAAWPSPHFANPLPAAAAGKEVARYLLIAVDLDYQTTDYTQPPPEDCDGCIMAARLDSNGRVASWRRLTRRGAGIDRPSGVCAGAGGCVWVTALGGGGCVVKFAGPAAAAPLRPGDPLLRIPMESLAPSLPPPALPLPAQPTTTAATRPGLRPRSRAPPAAGPSAPSSPSTAAAALERLRPFDVLALPPSALDGGGGGGEGSEDEHAVAVTVHGGRRGGARGAGACFVAFVRARDGALLGRVASPALHGEPNMLALGW